MCILASSTLVSLLLWVVSKACQMHMSISASVGFLWLTTQHKISTCGTYLMKNHLNVLISYPSQIQGDNKYHMFMRHKASNV